MRVDPVRDDEDGAVRFLREEVAQRAVERAREPHRDPVHADERVRAVEGGDRLRVSRGDARAGVLEREAAEKVEGGIGEIDDAGDGTVHRTSSLLRDPNAPGRGRPAGVRCA